jgi:hypothetical protein
MPPALGTELVKVATAGPEIDGILFDTPSATKCVVAVIDEKRGPVFRSFHPDAVSERTEEGPHDEALRLLIRRTPPPAPSTGRGAGGAARARAGHTRVSGHRTTGK